MSTEPTVELMSAKVQFMRNTLDEGEILNVGTTCDSVQDVSQLLVIYLAELPEYVVTDNVLSQLSESHLPEMEVEQLKHVINSLPTYNLILLTELFHFCRMYVDFEPKNSDSMERDRRLELLELVLGSALDVPHVLIHRFVNDVQNIFPLSKLKPSRLA
eukprot:Lithocolla_globosa_v1_NODE_617_length_3590_cov_10.342291.p2 type:complete len:159 gc:universal NODE_617_length_3590_cov_10.342291:2055-2531(+)